MVKKKKMATAALVLVIFLLASQMETAKSDAFDCYDACSTGCVQRDIRVTGRCDRKCQIKCGPDGMVAERGGG